MSVSPEQAVARELAPLLDDRGAIAPKIGVAVSGGGDSIALLHLVCDWARENGATVLAATIDHHLRAASGAEARGVAQACAALGVSHVTLDWQDWNGQGNVQAEARAARRQLLAAWADEAGLSAVLLGHTADDQAETFLMRLARGSGVDGLSCMTAWDKDWLFLRPLLAISRATLRDWLTARSISWVDDPSNDDVRFDRVKARQMLATLAPLGLTVERLNDTAAHMLRARGTLRRAAADWAARFVQAEGGDLIFAPEALWLGNSDVEARVFAAAVQWIGGAAYRPRYEALTDAACALRRGETRTLGGVLMTPHGHKGARLAREVSAAQGLVAAHEGKATLWDGRWRVAQTPPEPGWFAPKPGLGPWQIAALGEAGLAACKGWRNSGLPRTSLLSSPAVWAQDALVAAPLAGLSAGWQANLGPTFQQFILSH